MIMNEKLVIFSILLCLFVLMPTASSQPVAEIESK